MHKKRMSNDLPLNSHVLINGSLALELAFKLLGSEFLHRSLLGLI